MTYRPTELKALLANLGASAQKSLSQNFLIDRNILDKILFLAGVESNDWVLEIGPGPGALTEQLLLKGASVIAVDKDPLFVSALERLQNGRLFVHLEDIRTFDLQGAFKLHGIAQIKLVANLPYHLTTPILAWCLKDLHLFESITVMVQEEVARRMVAKGREEDYSSLSVFLQYHCDVQYGFKVSRNCFYPAPKVDSAVVLLTPRAVRMLSSSEEEAFFVMTRRAFQQRRKMLKKSLAELWQPRSIEEALIQMNLAATARPEELTWVELVELFKILSVQNA